MKKAGFFYALKWSIAGELASRTLQPLVFIILARLLTPDDYGVLAAAIMVISFAQIFWEAGLSKAIIQRQDDVEDAANVCFWINLVAGIIISLILFLSAEYLAQALFQNANVANVLRVMTAQIILGALSSVPTALLQKDMRFNKLFWVRITTVAVPGIFSIPLAWYGMSYWALVIGTLGGQLAQVVVLWKISEWRPTFSFNKPLARELGKFGAWVGFSGLLAWCYLWVDSLFVGAYLGTHQLGLYRTGSQLVTMIFGFVFTPLLPVLYSHFSSIQQDREQFKSQAIRLIRILTFVSIPMGFLLFAVSEPAATILFGNQWIGINFVIGVMALMQGYSWVVGANGELYRSMGKPSYESIVSLVMLFIYLIGYFFSIQEGFEVFVWTRYVLAMIALILHLYFGWAAIRLPVLSILKWVVIATVIGSVCLIVRSVTHTMIHVAPLYELILIGFMGSISTILLLFLIERNGLIKDLVGLYKQKFSRGT